MGMLIPYCARYGAANAEANRNNWGENLLGKALMRVRDRLHAEEEKNTDEIGKKL